MACPFDPGKPQSFGSLPRTAEEGLQSNTGVRPTASAKATQPVLPP